VPLFTVRGNGMNNFLGALAFIAVWILVSRWVLPRFGVQT
jgi:hypothetical protein